MFRSCLHSNWDTSEASSCFASQDQHTCVWRPWLIQARWKFLEADMVAHVISSWTESLEPACPRIKINWSGLWAFPQTESCRHRRDLWRVILKSQRGWKCHEKKETEATRCFDMCGEKIFQNWIISFPVMKKGYHLAFWLEEICT